MDSRPVFTSEPKLLSTQGQWLLSRVTEALSVVAINVEQGHVAGNMQTANKRALQEASELLDQYCKLYTPESGPASKHVTRKITVEETTAPFGGFPSDKFDRQLQKVMG